VFDLPEQIEKALQALFQALAEFCIIFFGIAFRPSWLAQRSANRPTMPLGPRTFLAISAYLFTRVARVSIASVILLFASLSRSCSADTVQDGDSPFLHYLKSQMTWPTTDDVILKTLPVILLVLLLARIFIRITWSNQGSSADTPVITLALCYIVGTQCIVVTPIAVAAALGLFAVLRNWWVPCSLLVMILIGWPCYAYYRFLDAMPVIHSAPAHQMRSRFVMLATGFFGSTLPLAASIGIAYPLAKLDSDNFEQPVIRAALLNADWDTGGTNVSVGVRILNNTSDPLLIQGDEVGLDTTGGDFYCGSLADPLQRTAGLVLSAHATTLVRATLKYVMPPPFIVFSHSVVPAAGPCSYPDQSLSHGTSNGGRFWMHSYSFDGRHEWIRAAFQFGAFKHIGVPGAPASSAPATPSSSAIAPH
jgi:hypothetical protein